MAETRKPKAGKKKTAKKTPRAAAATRPKRARTSASGNGTALESLAKLIEHPLVVELLSVGAIAAVAAIADHSVKSRSDERQKGSGKALKAAGIAAADAIGRRLSSEIDEIRKVSKQKKPAPKRVSR